MLPDRSIANRVMDWLADVIVDHRWLTFSFLLLVTTIALIGQVDPSLLLPTTFDPPAVTSAQSSAGASPQAPPTNVKPLRVSAADVIVVVQSDDFFSPAGVTAIRDVVEAIESLDHVADVFWLDRAPMLNLFGLPEPILPEPDASPARIEAARRRALEHPLVVGQLLSPDAQTLLLMVKLDWLFVEQDSDCTDKLRITAEQVAAKHSDVDLSFAVTGEVPIRLSRASSNRRNEIKYQIIGYVTAILIAMVLFRGLASVVIVAVAPAAGVFWTMGYLRLIQFDDNAFNSVILPVLLCMIGFTDGVHMMVQIRRHRAAGDSPSIAAKKSIREVGLACWLTSLTTAIGFGSLRLAEEPIVREFGICCVIGVALTFVSVITIIPWACTTFLGRSIHQGHDRNLIDRGLGRVVGVVAFVLRHARVVSWLGIGVTLLLAILALRLTPDERLTSALNANSEAAQALRHIDRSMGGMETAQVVVSWTPEIESNSGEVATVVQKVGNVLQAEPLVGHPLSLVSLLDALPGEGAAATRMSLLELLPPPLKRAYYTPEYQQAEVRFRIQDLGIARYGPVFARIEQALATIEREHPGFQLDLDGDAVVRWDRLYQIVVDLAWSLGTASLIIFVVLTLVYRSLRLGLISVIPNVFPLAATACLLLFTGQHLELVSVCAFTVCLGIAVDDTIHFLTRFREELRLGKPREQAIRDAFVSVGTALIMTTMVLVIGFSTALLSDARDHRIFAMMGMLTITSALFADLVFLPALLARYAPDADAED